MNKQELIERIKKLPFSYIWDEPYLNKEVVLEAVEQLDEPQKVVVPQFVADYIEFKKANDFHVYGAMRVIEDHYDKRVPEWFYEGNIEKFARAWLDGYEVEEKRYLVKIKNLNSLFCYLAHSDHGDYWSLTCSKINGFSTKHTRKQLEEAGFGWVLDCEGVEVQEVE